MALADYRLCDVCQGKAFYDANLNYNLDERGPDGAPKLDYLGDWAVICDTCARTHKCVVVPRAENEVPFPSDSPAELAK